MRAPVHVQELDGVRGFAILMVMALHFVCSQITQSRSWLESLAARLTGYGSWGVDLFFVLSGFLITGILWDSRGNPHYFRTFYARRTLRIFPLYYATLLLVVVLLPAGLLQSYAPAALQVREQQGWLWTYLTNVYVAKEGGFAIPYVSHFWTLAVEEHFYLVWPFVIGLVSYRTALRVSVVTSVVALALRVGLHQWAPNPFYAHVLTPCRLDALCIGSWLALAVRGPLGFAGFAASARRGLALAAMGVVLTSVWHVLARGSGPAETIRETMLALFFGFTIVLASWSEGPALLKRCLRARWLRFLGKYSYGLYVFHGIIAYAFGAHATLPHFERLAGGHLSGLFLQAAVGALASILISVASYELFEVRFLRLKKYFEARPPAAVEPAPVQFPAGGDSVASRTRG